MTYLTSPLSPKHDRTGFRCGIPSLDAYFQTQVSQDMKKKLAACFVIIDHQNQISGYYTLSSASVPVEKAPEEIKKKIPRAYTEIPAILLGRLAVDRTMQGKGLGERLLIDAMKRALEISAMLGSMALIVDPIDAQARSFYRKYGFISLSTGRMFLPMKTIEWMVL